MDRPDLLEKIKEEILENFPHLSFFVDRNLVFVRGSFPIVHEGKSLDRFSIEIELPANYPEGVPILREIGGRIPRILDYHIESPNGNICLFLPEDRFRVYPLESTLLDFLNVPVRNYFLGVALKQLGQPWPFGEWTHGVNGIIQYYSEQLGTDKPEIIACYLFCLSKRVLKGHWVCPCGSNEKLRNCHYSLLKDLHNKIPSLVVLASLKKLISDPRWLSQIRPAVVGARFLT